MELKAIDEAYRPHIDQIIRESRGIKYTAMFLEPNPAALTAGDAFKLYPEMHSIYVRGILERSHLACITSLARTSRWLSSTVRSLDDDNALAFSSSLRGLLEASSDSFHLLHSLFPSLESASKYIYIALKYPRDIHNGHLNFESLENLLIHYAYAQHWKRGEESLPHHRNKTNTEYIRCLENFGVSGLSDLYAELCQLTHPASPSVFCFVDETDESLTFNPDRDSLVIEDILSRYENSIIRLIQYPLNSALMVLSLLHRLEPDWPAMSDKGMSTIGNMAKILNEFDVFSNDYCPGTGISLSKLRSTGGH